MQLAISPQLMLELDELPEEWLLLKKRCQAAKQDLSLVQAAEVAKVKAAEELFVEQLNGFYDSMDSKLPMQASLTPEEAYERLDAVHRELLILESQAAVIHRRRQIFDLGVYAFQALGVCRKTLQSMKRLWDEVENVRSQFEDWMYCTWRDVDCGTLESSVRLLHRTVQSMDKSMRSWEAWIWLESQVRAFMQSLPLVQNLRNDALRSRHWVQLMQVCLRTRAPSTFERLRQSSLHVLVPFSERTYVGGLLICAAHRRSWVSRPNSLRTYCWSICSS